MRFAIQAVRYDEDGRVGHVRWCRAWNMGDRVGFGQLVEAPVSDVVDAILGFHVVHIKLDDQLGPVVEVLSNAGVESISDAEPSRDGKRLADLPQF